MSELRFLGALHVELIRHARLRPEHPDHELFQINYRLREAIAHLDVGSALHVELPPAVGTPRHGVTFDQAALRRLETDTDGRTA